MLSSKDFDAIIIDLEMPVMNGIEATKCLREIERARGADVCISKIIGITSDASEDIR